MRVTIPDEIIIELLNNVVPNHRNLSPELQAWCAKMMGIKNWRDYLVENKEKEVK